eukprot:TRINITY_DN241_c0_g1_i1.p1 TRINITY_DN241_c0_g1~~TRINITY_DN241_c0_g1_i1.p1  ORF type:complete len:330 (-),score=65.62 TRINITY_DN241_c0_g1_i1:15-1004(-)
MSFGFILFCVLFALANAQSYNMVVEVHQDLSCGKLENYFYDDNKCAFNDGFADATCMSESEVMINTTACGGIFGASSVPTGTCLGGDFAIPYILRCVTSTPDEWVIAQKGIASKWTYFDSEPCDEPNGYYEYYFVDCFTDYATSCIVDGEGVTWGEDECVGEDSCTCGSTGAPCYCSASNYTIFPANCTTETGPEPFTYKTETIGTSTDKCVTMFTDSSSSSIDSSSSQSSSSESSSESSSSESSSSDSSSSSSDSSSVSSTSSSGSATSESSSSASTSASTTSEETGNSTSSEMTDSTSSSETTSEDNNNAIIATISSVVGLMVLLLN